jgi:hypothetical protein
LQLLTRKCLTIVTSVDLANAKNDLIASHIKKSNFCFFYQVLLFGFVLMKLNCLKKSIAHISIHAKTYLNQNLLVKSLQFIIFSSPFLHFLIQWLIQNIVFSHHV